MYITFNELSVNDKFLGNKTRSQSMDLINKFVKYLRDLKKCKWVDGIIVDGSIYSFMVSDTYGINDWLNDTNVNQTHKQFYRTFLHTHYFNLDTADIAGEFKINIDGCELHGNGCSFAVQYEDPVLSIPTHDYWKQEKISGEYTAILENGDIKVTEQSVLNLYDKTSVEIIEKTERQNIYNHISSGQDLWEQREVIFPNLIFCDSVKAQLYKDSERFHIIKVMEKLQYLQDYFAMYDGTYNPKDIGISVHPESETVRNNPELRKFRLIRKPDGSEAYFFDHIKFTGKYSGGRIHFLPSDAEKKCYIGYIGQHLPTMRFG